MKGRKSEPGKGNSMCKSRFWKKLEYMQATGRRPVAIGNIPQAIMRTGLYLQINGKLLESISRGVT